MENISRLHSYLAIVSLGAKCIDFIKEDDTRFGISGSRENSTDGPLRLANVHVQQFGSFDRDEIDARLVGYGFGEQRLATPWWEVMVQLIKVHLAASTN